MELSLEHKNQDSMQQAQRRESQSSQSYPSRTIVHAKLEMTDPGDHDEQEADAVANAIVSGGKIARKISGGGGGSSGIAVSQQMESQLSQLQGGGRQMPEGLRNMMESGFGQDFSQVRLHTDSKAASMSSSIHAKAFTLGNDIYFNQGQFSPNTAEGQRLVAHELTHVVQGGNHIKRLPWKKFPCQYNYMVQDLMSGEAIKNSTEAVTDEEKKDSPEPQETDFDKLKRIVTSGDVNALIDHLIYIATSKDGYKEKNLRVFNVIKAARNLYGGEDNHYKTNPKKVLEWIKNKALRKEVDDLLKNELDDKGKKEILKAVVQSILEDVKSDIKTQISTDHNVKKQYEGLVLPNGKKWDKDIDDRIVMINTEIDNFKEENGVTMEAFVIKLLYGDHKTGYDSIAGKDNNTIFHLEIHENPHEGSEWCDHFVHWCFLRAFDPNLLKGWNDDDKNDIRNTILSYTTKEIDIKHMSGSVRKTINTYGENAFLESKFDTTEIDNKYGIHFRDNTFPVSDDSETIQRMINKIKKDKSLSENQKTLAILELKAKYLSEFKNDDTRIKEQEKFVNDTKNEYDDLKKKKRKKEPLTDEQKKLIKEYDKAQSDIKDYNNTKDSTLRGYWKDFKDIYLKLKSFSDNNKTDNTPRRGDVFFKVGHIGLVIGVSDDSIQTMEGNTNEEGSSSGDAALIKERPRSTVLGYAHPNYSGLLTYLQGLDIFKDTEDKIQTATQGIQP